MAILNEKEFLNSFEAKEEAKAIDTTRKLRIGFIGTGGIAHSHMRAYLAQPDVEIVCGADLVPGKAEAFFAEFGLEGVRCYTDMRQMLAECALDAVSVCTYNRTHAECTTAAMQAGLHVLLEKPMTVTLEEAVELCRVERETGRILSIGFQPRFDPNMKKIREIVESGVLGDIYYIQTGGGRRRGIPHSRGTTFIEDATAGIGALGDIGCYSLDMVLNALGYPKPTTITGYKSAFFGKNPGYYAPNKAHYAEKFGVDDFAAAFIRFETGLVLDFRISWAMHMDTPGDTILLGTKGGLRIPSTDCWNGTVGGPMKIYHEVAGSQVVTTIPVIDMKGGDRIAMKIRTFLDAILEGGTAPVPTSQILINQAIISGIADSANLGREIEVVIPEI